MPHRHAAILLIAIVIGVIAAGISGWIWGAEMTAVGWIGDLFLDALKMLIVPLIVAAVITGVASLGDVRKLGRLGGLTVAYYLATTLTAVTIGLIAVNLIQPGVGLEAAASAGEVPPPAAGFADILGSLISPNVFRAAADGELLPLIAFSILFAAALTCIGETGRPVIAFFEGVNEVMMKLVGWLMLLAPLGIFALVAARLGKAGGGEAFVAELAAVAAYVGTVLGGLTVHFALLCLVLVVLARRRLSYLGGMMRAIVTAFGTASSSATLPLTMECAREQGVSERASRFVLPLGSTVNMDGTALYEAVAVMFIAQAHGIELGLAEQIVVLLTATLAAIGAAGIPEAGLVTMVIVLEAVGLPLEGIGLLLAVDWFLDRFRTAVNVWGDSVGAAVIDRWAPATEAAPSE